MADVKEGSEVSELQEVLKILQLIFHRNKNQHRLTKWWKWLSILKRSVTKLVQELTGKESEAIRTRIRYMTEFVVPKCHL